MDNFSLNFLVFFLLIAIASGTIYIRKYQRAKSFPYTRLDFLFSQAERAFLSALEKAVGKQFRIFAKVRIADVIGVKLSCGQRDQQVAFNKISCKHFDFVLCDKRSMKIMAAVELDDRSHSLKERQERDLFVNAVCLAAKLPLIRVPVRRYYGEAQLQKQIFDSLE